MAAEPPQETAVPTATVPDRDEDLAALDNDQLLRVVELTRLELREQMRVRHVRAMKLLRERHVLRGTIAAKAGISEGAITQAIQKLERDEQQ